MKLLSLYSPLKDDIEILKKELYNGFSSYMSDLKSSLEEIKKDTLFFRDDHKEIIKEIYDSIIQ